ncbi:MAG: 2-phospho-L-lactate guanylyltransferase [Chloroflexota bacterium]|nr:2-phospho-L-lactate guanylyltransferase [Chloroflexota bacterium]
MSVRIIVPHRGLAAAKTRLAPVLDDAEREALARQLLDRVLAVAHAACGDVVVITPSAALEPLVGAAGARLVVQRGMGLNAGLEQARREALADQIDTLVVLHGDLPNLAADDISALVDAVPQPTGAAIAPDRAGGGTNGLALRPPDAIAFAFGVGSLADHREAAEAAGVPLVEVHRPGLAFDLDTPADLARWIELGDAA